MQNVLLALAVAMVSVYVALELMSNSPDEQLLEGQDKSTIGMQVPRKDHPIIGQTKPNIAKLYPGNCFAELYLRNPSFGGKLIESCRQKTVEQIESITGEKVDKSELTSPEVISYLKTTFGTGNPWRL